MRVKKGECKLLFEEFGFKVKSKTGQYLERDTRVQRKSFPDGRWRCVSRLGGRASGQDTGREGIIVRLRCRKGLENPGEGISLT